MKVFCIALEVEPDTGSQWFYSPLSRGLNFSKSYAKPSIDGIRNVEFDLEVPDNANPDEITKLVDEAAWGKAWLK